MKYNILYFAIKDEKLIHGINEADVVFQIIDIYPDFNKGKLFINGEEDSITYSDSYTRDEMFTEMINRSIVIIKRMGWTIYEGSAL